mmetsp:Transcript_2059/g.4323  ORF Transcript_2059/g.4323 Transcript_2059/m.4323 type:complete len:292 (-) Transcript_2059:1095-1970(-)
MTFFLHRSSNSLVLRAYSIGKSSNPRWYSMSRADSANNHSHSHSHSHKMNLAKPVIIFCHGSGDTGEGVQAWIQSLMPMSVYNQWDWIFPTATPIPYQLAGGQTMNVWFDRVRGFDPSFPEQTASIERSTDRLLNMLALETKQRGGPSRVAIGGFSMGGNIAYQTAARWHATQPESLGAVFGMSCYLNHDSKVWTLLESSQPKEEDPQHTGGSPWPPTFTAHGAIDDFILPQWGEETQQRLVQMGVPATFQRIPYVQHAMDATEIAQLMEFLDQTMNPELEAEEERLGQEL